MRETEIGENLEYLAITAVKKQIDSEREIPLSMLNLDIELPIVDRTTFLDENGRAAICMKHKLVSLEDTKEYLTKQYIKGFKIYLYRLCEQDVFDKSLKPTGKKAYFLSYCMRIECNASDN